MQAKLYLKLFILEHGMIVLINKFKITKLKTPAMQ